MVFSKSSKKSRQFGIHVLNYFAEEKIELKNNTKSLQCDVKDAAFLVSKAFICFEFRTCM